MRYYQILENTVKYASCMQKLLSSLTHLITFNVIDPIPV